MSQFRLGGVTASANFFGETCSSLHYKWIIFRDAGLVESNIKCAREGLNTEYKHVAAVKKQNEYQNKNSHDEQGDVATEKSTVKTWIKLLKYQNPATKTNDNY
jgi:hypothetical protein